MEKFQNSTDFSLKSVKITSLKGGNGYEIKQMVGTFSYVESVTSPFVAATMSLADSAGLLNGLPIQGGETVVVTVQTSSSEQPQEYKMLVWRIGNRVVKNNVQSYTLGLISEEALNNEYFRLIKPLKGTGDKIVNEILKKSLKSDKDFFSESTEFEMKLIPANRRPFDVISSIAVKSVAKGSSSSTQSDAKNEKQKVSCSAGFFFW